MPKRPLRDLTVGALAALALAILAITIMAVGGQSRLFARKVVYRVIFAKTEGLRVGSPVKMAGVLVGTVTGIRLPTDPRAAGIEAELGIETAYSIRVRSDSTATLRFLQWLSGEKYVDVTPGDPSHAILPEGSVIPVVAEPEFLQKGADIAGNLTEITSELRDILAPIQRGEGLIGQMIHDPDFGKEGLEHLRATLENLDDLTDRLRKGEGFAGRMLVSKEGAGSADDLSKSLKDLAAFTGDLARKEGALGALMEKGGAGEQAISELREAAASLRRTAVRLESKEGLLGRLLNDPDYSERVAEDLRTTVRNLAEITGKINQGQGTLGALLNERTLYDSAEDVVAGVNDSKFARWLLRHYQKKGIKAGESSKAP